MKDFLSPSNYIWLIPLASLTLLIILFTCYFLRREISSAFKNLFFPDTNRYTVPAGVISQVDENGKRTEQQPQPQDLKKEALQNTKKDRSVLRRLETGTRWGFRKFKNKCTRGFAEFAGTEDAPSKNNPGIIVKKESTPELKQEPAPEFPQQTAKQQPAPEILPDTSYEQNVSIKTEPAAAFIPEDIQEEYPDIPAAESKTVFTHNPVKEVEIQEPPEHTLTAIPVAAVLNETAPDKEQTDTEQKPLEKSVQPQEQPQPQGNNQSAAVAVAGTSAAVAATPADNQQKQKQPFISDRTMIIIAMIALVGVIIFLTARVKLLTSLSIRNHILIRDLQTQIEMIRYEQDGVKVVVHERATYPEKKI